MYIRRVKLENFKRHKALDVTFTQGINAICGPNGAGKSSIIEAIGLALFNYKPYRTISELVRKGTKRAVVHVEFEASVDQRLYTVERHIAVKGGGRYTIRDTATASVISEGATDSQELLQALLGLEPETKLPKLFETILGVPQGTITSAFLLSASERKSIFAPLLRVEEYESAWQKMKDVFLKPLKKEWEYRNLTLQHTQQQLETLPEKEELLQTINTRIKKAQAECKRLKEEMPQLQESVTNLRVRKEKRNAILQDQASFQKEVEHALEHIQKCEREHKESSEAYQIIKTEESGYKQYQKIKKEYDALRAQQTEYFELQKELQTQETKLHKAHIEHKQLQEQLQELEIGSQELQTLQPLLEQRAQLTQAESNLNEECKALSYIRERRKDLIHEQRTLRAEILRLERETEQLAQLQPLIERIKQVEEDGKKWRSKREQWAQEHKNRLEHIKQLKQLQEDLQQTFTRLQTTRENEQKLRDQHQSLAEQWPQHEEEWHTLQQQLSRLEAQIEREALFQKSVSDGLCPFFQETCKNVPQDQKLDQYIHSSLQRSNKALEDLKRKTYRQKEQKERSQRAHNTLKTQGEVLQVRIETEQRELHKLQKNLQTSETQLDAYPDRSGQLHQADSHLVTLRAQYKEIKPKSDKAVDFQPKQAQLEQQKRNFASKEQEIEKLTKREQELLQKEQQRLALVTQIKELDTPFHRAQELQHRVRKRPHLQEEETQLRKEIEQQQAQWNEHKKKLESYLPNIQSAAQLETQIQRLQPQYERYLHNQKTASKRQHTEQALNNAKETYNFLQKKGTELEIELQQQKPFATQELQEKESKLQQSIRRLGELEGRIPLDETRRTELQTELDALLLKKSELQTENQHQKEAALAIECGERIRKVFKDAGPHMTRTLIHSISSEADNIFRTLLNQHHFRLQWNESFELMVEEEGKERSFSNLSGGEQMAAALSVRMALIKELSNVRIAFFDEPTAHMDAERRYNLATQIGQIQGFDQLVVISHDDTFETLTDHVIRVPNV